MQNQVTARTNIDAFRTEVDAAGHALIADEPVEVGGSNEGPTPYDLLSAALASCTSMTLKMYAARKGIDMRSVTVGVTHGKIHAKDCEDCDSETGLVDQFERTIAFEGGLDSAEIERLLDIANKCPVHRTLENEIKIRTALAG